MSDEKSQRNRIVCYVSDVMASKIKEEARRLGMTESTLLRVAVLAFLKNKD